MIKDPALIIERVLEPELKRLILERHCSGNMQGAKVADWLGIAADADIMIETTEPFHESGQADALAMDIRVVFPELLLPEELISHAAIAVAAYMGDHARLASFSYFTHVKQLSFIAAAFVAGQLDAATRSV